jgi:hypothetical protein
MDSTVWGPPAWTFLHTITLAYPEYPTAAEKKSMVAFFNSLTDILPCHVCQRHYQKYLRQNPVETSVDTKDSLVKWLVQLHNQVNVSLSKPVLDLPTAIQNITQPYTDKLAKGTSVSYGSWGFLAIGILAIALLLWWKLRTTRLKIPKKTNLL